MWVTFLSTITAFLAPSVRTPAGNRVTLHGNGPPVLFSSGLFGTMPRQLYTELFRHISTDLTLVVVEGLGPITAEVVDDVADALAVERIGFLSHSSLDSDILNSSRIQSAVLCDPVVMPKLDWTRGGFVAPDSEPDFPVRILKAARAYEEETPGIPEMISPNIQSDDVSDRTFDSMGHADLLDDTWAEVGRQSIPWMKGADAPVSTFDAWSFDARRRSSELRDTYRQEVADEIVAHILKQSNGDECVEELSIQVV